jgi:hypothetical protein
MASTISRISIRSARADVMAVIADFPAYPQWASAVRSAQVVEQGEAGRARRVRFDLDAGMFRDSYVLGYSWDGDDGVRWDLSEPGSVISGMAGGYALADRGTGGIGGEETEVVYDLSVDVRIPMPGLLKRRAEKVIIDTALKGLKSRVEGGGGNRT